MSVDVFTMSCAELDTATLVGFRGKEAVSRPFEFTLFFTVPTGSNVSAAVGKSATLKANRGPDDDPMVFHGVIAGVSLLHQTLDRALYQASLVPKLWALRHFWRSYVFTGRKVKDFLSDTLKDGGLLDGDFQFSIDEGAYPTEEFVSQYRESHLDFFHRWLEREGLYYFFEHDPAASTEKLVIVDSRGQHQPLIDEGKVRYVPIFGDDGSAPQGFHQLSADVKWLPKTVTIADYDYSKPGAPLMGESEVTGPGHGAIREYGFRAFVDKDIKRLSQVRAESIGCREATLRASGDVLGIRSGYVFSVEDRPDVVDEKWLAIEVEHSGTVAGTTAEVAALTGLSNTETYRVKVLAVRETEQYRHPQSTAWPRIYGFENGVVCGDATSEYAQLDDDGRYMVRFEFDTSELEDGKASTRVRMLQPHGGDSEGFHFPLRKGTEVMIGFLGGDPDRPFIAGVVPNTHKPSVVGARNNTQNIIRTGSGNQIVMEDEAGKEFVYMSTPKDQSGIYLGNPMGLQSDVFTGDGEAGIGFFKVPPVEPGSDSAVDEQEIAFSALYNTGENHGVWAGGQYLEHIEDMKRVYVGKDAKFFYNMNYHVSVKLDAKEFYHRHRTTDVSKDWKNTVHENYELTVTENVTEGFGGVHDLTVGGGQKVDISGTHEGYTQQVKVNGKHKEHITGTSEITVDQDQEITVKGDQKITVHGKHSLDVKSDWKWNVLGHEIKMGWANSTELTAGIKNEMFLGSKTGVMVGGETGVFVGMKVEAALAIKIEAALAAKFAFNAGIKGEWCSALDLNHSPAQVNNIQVNMYTQVTQIQMNSITVIM